MKLNLITAAMATFIATSTSALAWTEVTTEDPFDGVKSSYKYSQGKVLKAYDKHSKLTKPMIILHEPKIRENEDKSEYTTRRFIFTPGDSYICSRKDKINLDIKLDGELQTSFTKELKLGDTVLTPPKEHKQVEAYISQSNDSLIVSGSEGSIPIKQLNGYQPPFNSLPYKLDTAKTMTIRYSDTCGGGGVYQFDFTKGKDT